MLQYENSLDKALIHSEYVFKHDAINKIIHNRTFYSKGYHELGKAQFYEGLKTNKTDLLSSSIINFEKAIKREPRNTEYYLRIGVARYLAANRQSDVITAGNLSNRALSDLHHAVKLDRTNGMMWFFYGSYLIKNWYDFWTKEDEQLRTGIDALSAAVSFRPSYLPRSFEKILKIDNKYATLYHLLNTVTSVKMLKKERLKRLATLHSLFSKQLKKHIIEIDFGTFSKTELLYTNDLLNQANAAMKLNNFKKALLLYEKVTKLPTSDENKIKAHAGIAASCMEMLRVR
jgi:tetratricopeptide (TPR) repeat protein